MLVTGIGRRGIGVGLRRRQRTAAARADQFGDLGIGRQTRHHADIGLRRLRREVRGRGAGAVSEVLEHQFPLGIAAAEDELTLIGVGKLVDTLVGEAFTGGEGRRQRRCELCPDRVGPVQPQASRKVGRAGCRRGRGHDGN